MGKDPPIPKVTLPGLPAAPLKVAGLVVEAVVVTTMEFGPDDMLKLLGTLKLTVSLPSPLTVNAARLRG